MSVTQGGWRREVSGVSVTQGGWRREVSGVSVTGVTSAH